MCGEYSREAEKANASQKLLRAANSWIGCAVFAMTLRSLSTHARQWWAQRPAAELWFYAGVLIVAGLGWIFAELASEVLEGETQRFDEGVLRVLREPGDPHEPVGPEWLEAFFLDVTALGGVSVVALFSLVVAGWLLLQRRLFYTTLVAISFTGAALVTAILKAAFGRERPPLEFQAVKVNLLSFPSGHSFMSAVVFLTLGVLLAHATPQRALKVYIVAVAVVLTGLVGLSRIYLGVHYPTDVLGGWCAGIVWAMACLLIAHLLRGRQKRRRTLQPSV